MTHRIPDVSTTGTLTLLPTPAWRLPDDVSVAIISKYFTVVVASGDVCWRGFCCCAHHAVVRAILANYPRDLGYLQPLGRIDITHPIRRGSAS